MDFEKIKKVLIYAGVGLVFSMFFLLMNGLGAFNFFYDVGNYVSEPVVFGVGQFSRGVQNLFSTIVGIGALREENTSLVEENDRLKAKEGEYSEILLQNEILLSQINTSATKNRTLVLARILGVDVNGISEHVIIDVGSDDGVSTGDAVVIESILVGEIRDVYKSTSRVRLVTNRNSNIVAMDRNTRAKGLVRGSLDGLVMEEILESEKVNVDDVIIVWSDNYPGNLVIGSINSVENDPTASTQKAYLKPAVNLENLNYVFVVLNE